MRVSFTSSTLAGTDASSTGNCALFAQSGVDWISLRLHRCLDPVQGGPDALLQLLVVTHCATYHRSRQLRQWADRGQIPRSREPGARPCSVSYTHLTLPTIYSV